MHLHDYLMLAIVGLVAGFSGGLLGVGGAIIMIPGMVMLFGEDQQHLYQATAMIVSFFIVAPAVLRHVQARATLRPITRRMVPAAMIGVIAGVQLSDLPVFRGRGQGYLQIAFSAFLAYVLLSNLKGLGTKKEGLPRMTEQESSQLPQTKTLFLVGLPTGILSGLLGIGGGLYAVPAQQIFLRIPLRNAIANSASTMLWTSLVGAMVKNINLSQHGHSWHEALIFALCLIPTAMAGSWYTAKKVHQWPVSVTRVAFVVILLYCGVRIFFAGWRQIHGV